MRSPGCLTWTCLSTAAQAASLLASSAMVPPGRPRLKALRPPALALALALPLPGGRAARGVLRSGPSRTGSRMPPRPAPGGLSRAGCRPGPSRLPFLLLLLAVLLLHLREAGTCSAASCGLQLPQCMTERGAARHGNASVPRFATEDGGLGFSCRAHGSVSPEPPAPQGPGDVGEDPEEDVGMCRGWSASAVETGWECSA